MPLNHQVTRGPKVPTRRQVLCSLVILALTSSLVQPSQAKTAPKPQRSATNQMVSLVHASALKTPTPDAARAADQHLMHLATTLGFDVSEFHVERVIDMGHLATVRYSQIIAGVAVSGSLIAISVNDQGAMLSYTAKIGRAPTAQQIHTTDSAAILVARSVARDQAVASVSVSVAQLAPIIIDSTVVPSSLSGSRFGWGARVDFLSSNLEPLFVIVDDATGDVVTRGSVMRHAADTSPLVCDMQRTSSSYRKSGAPKTILTYSRSKKKYVNASSAPLPICDKGNAGNSPNKRSALDKWEFNNAITDINQTVQYFKTYVGVDINDEQYLGNISPLMNYNSKLISAGECSDNHLTDDICQPRISAFTNVCAIHGYQYCQFKPKSKKYSATYPQYYANAFWTAWYSKDFMDNPIDCGSRICSGIFFGKGYVADDVVAHELSHGISSALAFSGGLSNDAEALSEAYSDFFGEAVDQLTVNGTGTTQQELADSAFKLGEDVGKSNVSGKFISKVVPGPFRDMQGLMPGAILDITADYSPAADSHINNGPANRFVWLITHGDNAIGTEPFTHGDGLCIAAGDCTAITKMTRLAFESLNNLTSAATYLDFGDAMMMACSNLVSTGTGTSDLFVAGDCVKVRSALDEIHAFSAKFTDVSVDATLVSSLDPNSTWVSGTAVELSTTLGTLTTGLIADAHVQLQSSANAADWSNVLGASATTDDMGQVWIPSTLSLDAGVTYYRFVYDPAVQDQSPNPHPSTNVGLTYSASFSIRTG